MKRSIVIFLTGLFLVPMAFGQMTFSEKRQRDKAFHEAVTLILLEEYEMASAELTRCLDIDSSFAPAYLQRGRILIQWGSLERAMDDLDSAIHFDPDWGRPIFIKAIYYLGPIPREGMPSSSIWP